ncbi:MAG: hypothetical protein ACE5DQ_01440, partial [Candidatus Paceibacterota bacterium]
KAHNEFLQYFATTGFLGLGAYLLLVGSVSARGLTYFWHRKKGILALAFSTSYFSILITNFFGFSTTMTNIYFYLIPAFLVVIYAPEPLQSLPARVHLTHRTRQVLLYILPFVVLVYGLYYVANYLAADIFYARAEAFKRTQDFDSAFQNALIARTLRSEHVYEDLLSSILANSVLINSYALSETKELEELIKLSDKYSAQAVRRSPQNVAYWKTKARNNFLFYQAARDKAYYSKSLKALRIAQKLAPTDPKLYYTHALFAYSLYQDSPGEVDLKLQALKKLDKAIELKKDYKDAYFLKAQLLIALGDKNQAKKQLEYILDNIDPSDIQAQEELRTL